MYSVVETIGTLTLTVLMDGLTSTEIPIIVNIIDNETLRGSYSSKNSSKTFPQLAYLFICML